MTRPAAHGCTAAALWYELERVLGTPGTDRHRPRLAHLLLNVRQLEVLMHLNECSADQRQVVPVPHAPKASVQQATVCFTGTACRLRLLSRRGCSQRASEECTTATAASFAALCARRSEQTPAQTLYLLSSPSSAWPGGAALMAQRPGRMLNWPQQQTAARPTLNTGSPSWPSGEVWVAEAPVAELAGATRRVASVRLAPADASASTSELQPFARWHSGTCR
jgi:hypothetical protein